MCRKNIIFNNFVQKIIFLNIFSFSALVLHPLPFFGVLLYCAFIQTFISPVLSTFILYLFVVAPCFTVLSHVSSSCLVSFPSYLCSYFLFSHIYLLSSVPVSTPFCMNIVPTVHFLTVHCDFCLLFYTVHIVVSVLY